MDCRKAGLLCLLLLVAGCTTAPEVYFCPQEQCAERIRNELKQAEHEVLFATYSFTHPALGTQLVLLKEKNVTVRGVIEKQTTGSQYSQFNRFMQQGIAVFTDRNRGLMHHKVFVIDGKTVITGSFNPSKNADERNNENIVIIRNENTARRYSNEIERIIREGK